LVLRTRERRFYLVAAILFAFIIVAGFARTYYLKGFFDAPPLASFMVHLHGIAMTGWVALFALQVWFIRTKKIRYHQTLGLASIVLAVFVVVIGFFTALSAAKNGAAAAPPDVPPLAFLVVPLTDLVMFIIFFSAAIYFRKQPANHKRMMLLTAVNFLPPAVARLPITSLTSFGPLFFFGLPALLLIVALIYDTWHHGRLNKLFLAGALLLIASYPLRLLLSGTGTWMQIAAWLTKFAIV
jgi:hypothetical protein